MATITLRDNDANDAGAFIKRSCMALDAWRERNPPLTGPRTVVCTRCSASVGKFCKNLTTGKRARTFHPERLKRERRARALFILREHGPMTAADFAEHMWPDCDPHTTARNAAGFLTTLWREGLTRVDHNSWGTTYRARR